MTNLYNTIEDAEFYDWQNQYRTHQNPDIAFYRSEVARWGDPVLELACGTGRICLPLARAGHTVTGLDSSRAMLNILERNAAAEQLAIKTVQGDMADFDLGQRYRTIILAYNALLLLNTLEKQRDCLVACKRHLAPDGAVIISVFAEAHWEYTLFTESDTFDHDWTRVWEERNLVVSQMSRQRRDRATRCTHWEGRLESIAPDGSVQVVEQELTLRWDSRAELEAVLAQADLTPYAWYGTYKHTPLDGNEDVERMIVVCG